MDNLELQSNIEAVLFLKGEPMKIGQLAKIFEVGDDDIIEALELLQESLSGRGIRLVEKDGSVALATAPESSQFTKSLIEEEFDSSLTKAALETMSIVVYRGPVSRADIDYIRGVNSSFILRNLLIRGLVERTQNPRDSRSYLYKPSFSLLRHLGAQNIEELPEYGNFNEKMEEFVQAAEAEKETSETNSDLNKSAGGEADNVNESEDAGVEQPTADFEGEIENENKNEKHQNNINTGVDSD